MRRWRFSSYVFIAALLGWSFLLWSVLESAKDPGFGHGLSTMGYGAFLLVWIVGGIVALIGFAILRLETRGRG